MCEALLWTPLKDGAVRCGLCNRFCPVKPGERGKCGVRENRDGTLFTLVGDRVAAANLDPVEKKPLYHFMPGTSTFSFGTPGCNLECSFCQNWSLSQGPKNGNPVGGERVTPEGLVDAAIRSGAASISYTYSEPTIFFELMLKTAQAAKGRDLKNIIVSNGYMSIEALDMLCPVINAANIDLKAFTEEFYRERCGVHLKPVLENLKHIKKAGVWLEVTTLVIPGLNDSEKELAEIAGFIAGELGPDTPWHVSRFHPDYRLRDRGVTPVETLESAWELGTSAGLKYVYIGNVPGSRGNNTFCPGCGEMVVNRTGFHVGGRKMDEQGACVKCGTLLDFIF